MHHVLLAGEINITVSPDFIGTTWRGWGTSLAWFANYVGGLPQQQLTAILDLIFDPINGLGLNIVRYNIGGGHNNTLSPQFNQSLEAHWRGIPGYKPTRDGPYNWSADERQRNVLLGAKERGANVFEAFSNSPPWWMTKSGDVAGAVSKGETNMRPEYEDDFADYLTTVVAEFAKRWGVTFDALEPFNEALEGFWMVGKDHEGCNFNPPEMGRVIKYTSDSLQAKGLTTKLVGVDSWDGTTAQYFKEGVAATYEGRYGSIRDTGKKLGKEVWVSEAGALGKNGSFWDLSLYMARNVIESVNIMEASAYHVWQAYDFAAHWSCIDFPPDYPPGYSAEMGPPIVSLVPAQSALALSGPARTVSRCPAAHTACPPHVAPCCSPHVTPCCSVPHALLQPARRALLPYASRFAAASASRPTAASASAAPRVAPCCSQRVALCCPPRHLAATAAAAAAAAAAVAARATAAGGGGAAWSAGSAAGAGGAGGATGSAGGAADAGGAGPTTDRHCLSWPLSRQLQRLWVDSGGHCLSQTTPSLSSFASGFFSEPIQVVEALVFYVLHRGGSRAAALGASESAAALGASESAAVLGARASPAIGPSSAEALHTFTLDSGVSRCFFCDCTTLTPLAAPVPVSLADPTGGPVVARASTVLPCPAVPSGSLSGLHLSTFSTNLVNNAAIQDVWVDTFIPRGYRVAICTCSRTGRHLATFTRRPGSSLYTLTTASAQVGEAGQVAASSQVSAPGQLAVSCSCRELSHQTLLWHHRLGHPSLPRLRSMHSRLLVSSLPKSLPSLPRSPAPPCLPCDEGRQRAAPHSSEFPPTTAPLQTLHMDVWGPAVVSGMDQECYFMLVVDDYIRYTIIFPLRRKADVNDVLIPWIRATRRQLRERFSRDSQSCVCTLTRALNLWPRVSEPERPRPHCSGRGRLAMRRSFGSGARSPLFVIPKRASSPLALSAVPSLDEYSSQWLTAMDAEMASWKSTGTYVDEVPLPGANIVDGMWIFKMKHPPGFQPAFKAHYVARGFRQPSRGDLIAPPTWLHWVVSRGYPQELPATSLRIRQAPQEWHNTLMTTLAALGFAPSSADPSLFLRTDTTLPPFYVLVYVDDFVFATADTEALALVKAELQERHACTDLGELRSYLGLQITRDRARRTITMTMSHMVHQVLQCFDFHFSSPQPTPLSTCHSFSAPPLDKSVEPIGPYPELVGCLMYLITCTRPDLAYPLSLLARYVAPGRHRKVHWDASKRVLRYLCSTSGMGLVLGGQGSVVLTGHSDAFWADDQATKRSSQGYTFSLGSGSVSWRSTRSTSMLGSSCEAEIYAGAMAAQELRWLTYLLTNLGERPRSPPVLYINNKAMLALCHEQRMEHRTKHITICYFPCA
ncbi:unnamed protein product [Closterium sp. NIES-54]